MLKHRTGSGKVSACGGNGFGGGGGGRVATDVFSRHEDPKIYVHGSNFIFFLRPIISELCPFLCMCL